MTDDRPEQVKRMMKSLEGQMITRSGRNRKLAMRCPKCGSAKTKYENESALYWCYDCSNRFAGY